MEATFPPPVEPQIPRPEQLAARESNTSTRVTTSRRQRCHPRRCSAATTRQLLIKSVNSLTLAATNYSRSTASQVWDMAYFSTLMARKKKIPDQREKEGQELPSNQRSSNTEIISSIGEKTPALITERSFQRFLAVL